MSETTIYNTMAASEHMLIQRHCKTCSNLMFFLALLLIWITVPCFCLLVLVLRQCLSSDDQGQLLRYSVAVFTAVNLIVFILAVVALVIGDTCNLTSTKMNDKVNRLYAQIVVSLAGVFTVFCMVILIVLYMRSRNKEKVKSREIKWTPHKIREDVTVVLESVRAEIDDFEVGETDSDTSV